VYVINCATNTIITTITVGTDPLECFFVSSFNKIYVANNGSSNMSVIDCTTNLVTSTIALSGLPAQGGVQGMAFVSIIGADKLYVPNSSVFLDVIDVTTDTLSASINVGGTQWNVAYNSTNNKIYTNVPSLNKACVINPSTDAIISNPTINNSATFMDYDSVNNNVYVSRTTTTAIAVIDGVSNLVTNTIATPAQPQSLYYDSTSDKIFVGLVNNSIIVIDGATQTITSTISTSNNTHGFYPIVEGRNILFGGNGLTIDVIDMDTSTIVNAITSTSGSIGCGGFSPTSNRIFLIDVTNQISIITTIPLITNTLVQIEVESGIGYDALVSELSNGYYEIDYVNVYANNIEQANQRWEVNDKKVSGVSSSNENYPTISPMQQQFVVDDIPIKYIPITPNTLRYTLNGLQSVRLIFHYKTIALDNDMPNAKNIDMAIKNTTIVIKEKYLVPLLKAIYHQSQLH
jgi:YVTN family beta-propeller protein